MSEKFSEKMAHRRKQRGMTQLDLASLSGICRGTIASFENKESEPSLKVALKISKILNIKLDKLPIE